MTRWTLTAALAAMTLAGSAAAQLQAFAGTSDRKTAQVFLFTQDGGFNVHGLVSVHYGQPEWKDSYAEQIKGAEAGTRARLGKDIWTTLDTSCALKAGDTTIPAGFYYLLAEMGAEGKLNLVLLDPKAATEQKLNPSTSNMAEGGIVVPLTTDMEAEPQQKLTMEIKTGDDAKNLSLVIHWGPVQATAKMVAQVDA